MGRACPCLSLHLVSPVHEFMLRKLRKSRGSITGGSDSAWRLAPQSRAATSKNKVGPCLAHIFLLYVSGANPSCFGVIFGFMGCADFSGQNCRGYRGTIRERPSKCCYHDKKGTK